MSYERLNNGSQQALADLRHASKPGFESLRLQIDRFNRTLRMQECQLQAGLGQARHSRLAGRGVNGSIAMSGNAIKLVSVSPSTAP